MISLAFGRILMRRRRCHDNMGSLNWQAITSVTPNPGMGPLETKGKKRMFFSVWSTAGQQVRRVVKCAVCADIAHTVETIYLSRMNNESN